MRLKTKAFLPLVPLAWFLGCGVNVFEEQEAPDPAEDAVLALERQDEDGAIKILEDALADDKTNPRYLSILALAYAQRAGIEPLQFAQRVASQESGSDGSATSAAGVPSAGDYTSLFSVMPDASVSNLADLDRAVEILTVDMGAAERLAGDTFKLALYQTASVILHTKALDTNGDGQLTLDEILNLSAANAAGILTQIASAAILFAGGSGESDSATKEKAAEALAKFQTKIDEAPGATQEEKLKNYLASSNAASAQAAAAAQAAAQAGQSGSDATLPAEIPEAPP